VKLEILEDTRRCNIFADIKKNGALLRVLPFALFMAFIGLEQGLRFCIGKGVISLAPESLYYLYPVKACSVGLLLVLFRNSYPELRLRELRETGKFLVSFAAGVVVFLLWIRMDWSFATQGTTQGFNPSFFENTTVRGLMTITRLVGAVLVVPVMEELFWRSFLVRYIIDQEFAKVPIGRFTWPSFLTTAILFGLEHHLFLAGVMAGIVYNLLLYYTRSIALCIIAHAVTNLALGIYVLATGKWYFW
jgi:CAAX prenyl protease-like protein